MKQPWLVCSSSTPSVRFQELTQRDDLRLYTRCQIDGVMNNVTSDRQGTELRRFLEQLSTESVQCSLEYSAGDVLHCTESLIRGICNLFEN